MDFAAIPMSVLDSPKYKDLHWGDQRLLIDLYILFGDCDTFFIDLDKPQEYRQSRGNGIARRINRIIEAGFLEICGTEKCGSCSYRRIFRLTHPIAHVFQLAA